MTSLAFILGMIPLVIAGGAGAASRHAVGTGVMGGMITATVFGIFFTPVFYLVMRLWFARKRSGEAAEQPEAPTAAEQVNATYGENAGA
jgi:multidrug efflux pump